MARAFDVEMVAADRKLFSGQAIALVLPGAAGYMGVLAGHEPLITALAVGELDITQGEDQAPRVFALSGGFAQITPERVVILADTAESVEQIDFQRALLAKERAEERLRMAEVGGIDVERAKAALLRALNRLRVAEHRQ